MKKNNLDKNSDEYKIKVINRFCSHLKKGMSEYSFVECDYRDIERYADEIDAKGNNESQVEKIKKALRESFLYWEKLALEIFFNSEKKAFFPLWIYYVKNRFHWGIEDNRKPKTKYTNIEIPETEIGEIKNIGK